MAFYQDGKPVSGLNSIPRLTLAQYNALNVKPEFWVRTDAPESYKKLSADQVSYDSNNTVEDKLDEVENIWSVTDTYWAIQTYKHNKIVQIRMEAQRDMSIGSGGGLVTTIPNTSLPIETYVKCSNDSTSTDFVIHTDGKIYGTANTIKNGAIYNAIFLIN